MFGLNSLRISKDTITTSKAIMTTWLWLLVWFCILQAFDNDSYIACCVSWTIVMHKSQHKSMDLVKPCWLMEGLWRSFAVPAAILAVSMCSLCNFLSYHLVTLYGGWYNACNSVYKHMQLHDSSVTRASYSLTHVLFPGKHCMMTVAETQPLVVMEGLCECFWDGGYSNQPLLLRRWVQATNTLYIGS